MNSILKYSTGAETRPGGNLAAGSGGSRVNPILIEAVSLMTTYARATNAWICVEDQNCTPVPEENFYKSPESNEKQQVFEFYNKISIEKNVCQLCMKNKTGNDIVNSRNFCRHSCRDLHNNAISTAVRSGGSHTFMCELGFLFWTSPVYADKHFIGALLGGGYLGVDREEASALMSRMCNETVFGTELTETVNRFPMGEPGRIKSLAELLNTCAKSLSAGSSAYLELISRRAQQQADLAIKLGELKNIYPSSGMRPEYPLDKEQKLIEALEKGDNQTGRELLNEILAVILFLNPNDLKYIQYRAIELAILLLRTGLGSGSGSETTLKTNKRYITFIQEAKNIEELTDALCRIVDDMAGRIYTFQGVRHASALKKAECYILENYTRKISLTEIASASGFSAPYFSTIFKEEMGENLSSYLNRLRVEKAGYLLVNTNLSLSRITRACGFEDQSWFSKIFKSYAGISPGKYRSQGLKKTGKLPDAVLS